MSFTGVPGNCLAINAAWRTKSCGAAAPSEAATQPLVVRLALGERQPGNRRERRHGSLRVLRRVHASAFSGVMRTVVFIGSMQECERKGVL